MPVETASDLIPTPERPELPLRVPLLAEFGSATLRAEVLGSTEHVLLLQGPADATALPSLGTPIRLRSEWDRQTLNGRIAAHGVAGRFLVTLGERAIRRSRRYPVDLPGLVRSAYLPSGVDVRIVDLSAGGARVQGVDLPLGSDVNLQFTPPNQGAAVDVLGFVVRKIEHADVPTIGVAYRLGQPSTAALTTRRQSAPSHAA